MALDDEFVRPDRDEYDPYEEEVLAVERAAPFVVPQIVRTSGRWGKAPTSESTKPRELTREEQRRLDVENKIDTPRGVLLVCRAPFITGRPACPTCKAPKVITRAPHFGGGSVCYGCGREVAPRGSQ
jgi:hypothetical protein